MASGTWACVFVAMAMITLHPAAMARIKVGMRAILPLAGLRRSLLARHLNYVLAAITGRVVDGGEAPKPAENSIAPVAGARQPGQLTGCALHSGAFATCRMVFATARLANAIVARRLPGRVHTLDAHPSAPSRPM